MKCLVLLTLVALCYSYPYGSNTGGRSVNISEDGTIVITGRNGKRVSISKGVGVSGQKNIEIAISGPNIPTKRIQINENNELRGGSGDSLMGADRGELDVSDEYQRDKRSSSRKRSQTDTLSEILGQYQGTLDDTSYEQLLKKVAAAVRSGQLSESLYDVLQSINQGQYPVGVGPQYQGLWAQQGEVGGITSQQAGVFGQLQRQRQLGALRQQKAQQQYQQGAYYGGPFLTVFGQGSVGYPYRATDVVSNVPVEIAQGRFLEEVLPTTQPQGIYYSGDIIYTPKSIGVGGGRNGVWEYLLNDFDRQQKGISASQIGQPVVLSQIIENERDVLDQQQYERQLQQLQQEQQQQQLLQAQLQAQMWQQQQQKDQLQPYDPLNLNQYLLNRPIQSRVQQSSIWQQLGFYPQGRLSRAYVLQRNPLTSYNVPLVL